MPHGGNVNIMTVMGDARMNRLSDAGSIPARSTFCKKCEKCINAGNACKIRLLRIFIICYDSGILVEFWLF